jgi:reversibly glycosylated polypeptide/UDP-arabinopyranose mutase
MLRQWLAEWKRDLWDVTFTSELHGDTQNWGIHLVIVEDNPEKTFQLDDELLEGIDYEHVSWKEIDDELGKRSWIIPRRTDCIRSFGFYRAAKLGAQAVITLDDDVKPYREDDDEGTVIEEHLANLHIPTAATAAIPAWTSTISPIKDHELELKVRGYPYRQTKRQQRVVISHGMWTGYPDLDSVTQLVISHGMWTGYPDLDSVAQLVEGWIAECCYQPKNRYIPMGIYYPMCGMNLAFVRELIPIMYFLLMGESRDGEKWPVDRFGDIWAGIISKKIIDYFGWAVWSGFPYVHHTRMSDVWTNFEKERVAIRINEDFWKVVDAVALSRTLADCYYLIAGAIGRCTLGGEVRYWKTLATAMQEWVDLIDMAMV